MKQQRASGKAVAMALALIVAAIVVAFGYLYLLRARQEAIGQIVQKLAAPSGDRDSQGDLDKVERLAVGGVKLAPSQELVIAGAYARSGNDDRALDWYKRAVSDSQNQSLPAMVASQVALAHFYSVKTEPDIQDCGSQYDALRSALIANGSPTAQSFLAEVDMMHAEDLISYVRSFYSRISFMQASADLTQSNDLLWRALSRCKSATLSQDKRDRLQGRIQADQLLLSKLVQ